MRLDVLTCVCIVELYPLLSNIGVNYVLFILYTGISSIYLIVGLESDIPIMNKYIILPYSYVFIVMPLYSYLFSSL
ncbi:hypothetical protein IWW34DRAFT_776283 [Fusarium oxysporum f. sp. albedinis]|nr:hypothetical protein IWW34DRAFT_776283 [Fusarium oxysporum f. sp. albedinis]